MGPANTVCLYWHTNISLLQNNFLLTRQRVPAGVSCSFAAPIGGLLLSIEEGASFYSTSLFWRGFLATCTGVCTLHFLAQFDERPSEIFDARFGIRRDLGLYDDNIALYGSRFWYYIWELPIYVIIGCIAGALGGWFIKLNIIFTAFRAKYIPASNRWRRFGEVSICLFVSLLACQAQQVFDVYISVMTQQKTAFKSSKVDDAIAPSPCCWGSLLSFAFAAGGVCCLVGGHHLVSCDVCLPLPKPSFQRAAVIL